MLFGARCIDIFLRLSLMSSHPDSPLHAPEIFTSPLVPFPLLTPESAHRAWDPAPDSDQNGNFITSTNLTPTHQSSAMASIDCHLAMTPSTLRPPHRVLQTPSGSEVAPNQDPCYFSLPSDVLTSSPNRQPQLDNLSTPGHLSPDPPSGGSCHSCPTTYSINSNSSADYLSPPPPPPDCGQPPYKSRRASDGLKMMPKPKRARTMPQSGTLEGRHDARRTHRHHHRRVYNSDGYPNHSRAYSQDQQVRQRYQERKKVLQSREREFKLQNSPNSIVSSSHDQPVLMMSPAVHISNRRWSSTDSKITNKKPPRLQNIPQPGIFTDALLSTPGRYTPALTQASREGWPRAPPNTDEGLDFQLGTVIDTIRDILTVRKVGPDQLEPPSSITLTKPSSDDHKVASPGSTIPIINLTPLELTDAAHNTCGGKCSSRLFQRRPTGTFLITSKDVQAIADLVEAEINSRARPCELVKHPFEESRSRLSPPIRYKSNSINLPINLRKRCIRRHLTAHDYFDARTLTKRKKKLSAQRSASIHTLIWGMTGSESCSNGSDDETPAQFDSFYRGFSSNRSDATVKRIRGNSEMNKQEVIWKPGESPIPSPTPCNLPRDEYFISEPNTPLPAGSAGPVDPKSSPVLQVIKTTIESATPFDSNQMKMEFFPGMREWIWEPPETTFPAKKSPLVASAKKLSSSTTDGLSESASESGKSSKRKKQATARRRPRLAASESQLKDVVSFPPLAPRKTTNDWYSPLPDIDVGTKYRQGRSLYNVGLDINCGPSVSPSVAATPRSKSWVRSGTPRPPMTRSDLTPRVFRRSLTMPHVVDPKGSIKVQPKAAPKTGVSDETCSRLDVCAAKRSTDGEQKAVKRVKTIDCADKGKRASTWSPLRPPSVCPPLRPPTPNEIESDPIENLIIAETNTSKNRDRAPTIERVALLREKSPQGPKDDCAGIYRRLTGTSRGGSGSERDACNLKAGEGGVKRELGRELRGEGSSERNPSVDWIA